MAVTPRRTLANQMRANAVNNGASRLAPRPMGLGVRALPETGPARLATGMTTARSGPARGDRGTPTATLVYTDEVIRNQAAMDAANAGNLQARAGNGNLATNQQAKVVASGTAPVAPTAPVPANATQVVAKPEPVAVIPGQPPGPGQQQGTPPVAVAPTGLGVGQTDPNKNPNVAWRDQNVGRIAAGMMGQDSPLMQKAAAEGRGMAADRGMMNSTLAGQASQAAMLDVIVPMASQTAQQNYGLNQTRLEGRIQGTLQRQRINQERLAQKNINNQEARIERRQQMLQATLGMEASRTQAKLEDRLQRGRMKLENAFRQSDLNAGEKRAAEGQISNIFNDYTALTSNILSNPDLSAAERTAQLNAARNTLQTRMEFTRVLYEGKFDWPKGMFQSTKPATTTPAAT